MEMTTATSFSIGLFAALVWFRSARSRSRSKLLHEHGEEELDYYYEQEDDASQSKWLHFHQSNTELGIDIGPRGQQALKKSAPYWSAFLECLKNPCHLMNNPTGHIALCLAENKLVQESLALRLMQPGTTVTAFSDSIAYCYHGFLGLPIARIACAYFLQKRFWKPSTTIINIHTDSTTSHSDNHTDTDTDTDTTYAYAINPDHIVLGSGVGSLLSHLFFIIAELHDVILVPAPYYAKFDFDAKAIAGCSTFPIYMENPIIGPQTHELENAFRSCHKLGKRVKALLITNPNDPLGVIYKNEVILQAILWARSKSLHTIIDEVYALSVHNPLKTPFQSIIQILDNQLGNDVHFLWGLSKDFGASGFRVAILYSQNIRIIQALANLNTFSGVSHPMQLIVAEILSDDDFIDSFLEDSRTQIVHSYQICSRKLEEMVIPHVHAVAGLFVYVDFSSLLPENSFRGEAAFARLMHEVTRVVMTPGRNQHDSKPGMFRLCYTWVSPEVLEVAMERLSLFVLRVRRSHWDDLVINSSLRDDILKGSFMTQKGTTQMSLRRAQSISRQVNLSNFDSTLKT